MEQGRLRDLCLQLLRAETGTEVISILRHAKLWDDPNRWRLYGDKEGNFAQAGNQQALPEAALVEKVVNCCDARLTCECLLAGIDPESDKAPQSVRDAVAMFFENRRAHGDEAGSLTHWAKAKRTEQSRFITIAATGYRPARGHRMERMCLTIADQGEGQSAARLPRTILSLNEKNKQRVRFVQGKFNMGGSGALRFCSRGLQLVISRRHPELATRERAKDPTADDWAFTVIRREEPSNKSGEPVHSEFTYLAPLDAERNPRRGSVLHFHADDLPLMPEHDEAYKRAVHWGTAIKLYEYETTVGQSNVLMKDGLLFALERLLPEIALPIRMHECRGYQGDKERSFETPIAGLVVRLEDGKGDNLEPGFPLSVQMQVGTMHMTARIYAFKEDRAQTYLHDEGVIFAVNGQAHGYLPKSIFTRPKAVGLPRLRDSLLVLVDCSSLSPILREDLFMSSRDRLSKKPIRYDLEHEIEELLRNNTELRRLQQERRERDVESKLSEEKPLELVLGRVFTASPTLKALFLRGQRLPRPFQRGGGGSNGDQEGDETGERAFVGKRHPTYFRIPDAAPGAVFRRNCEHGRRCHIKFETDVENAYFDRATDRGSFELETIESSREVSPVSFSLSLEDGVAYLNLALPAEVEAGDHLVLQASVTDPTLSDPFTNVIKLTVVPKQVHPPGPTRPRQNKHAGGGGHDPSEQGIQLPRVISVHEGDEHWQRYQFDASTSCHVISDPVEVDGRREGDEHTFYVNVDNISLKTEMKYAKQDPRLLEAKFKYGNVLLGLAILHDSSRRRVPQADVGPDDGSDSEPESPQDLIRRVSSAVAPVLLPIIDQLSGLEDDDLQELSSVGEDA